MIEKRGAEGATNGALPDGRLDRRRGGGGRAISGAGDALFGKVADGGRGRQATQFERRSFDVMTVEFDHENVIPGLVQEIT